MLDLIGEKAFLIFGIAGGRVVGDLHDRLCSNPKHRSDHPLQNGVDPMKNRLTVVGLGGSLSKHSNSLAALKIALEGAAGAGAHTEVFDVRELALPMYEPGSKPPKAVLEMAEAMYNADGLIWSSPMYHGTISGSFKNALDWLQVLGNRQPSYLTDKVVGLITQPAASKDYRP